MEGKKNPYDPAELFRQWLENASKMQSDFTTNVNNENAKAFAELNKGVLQSWLTAFTPKY